ncbi:DUF547 domain-containing protein [Seonamhaeicola marinus]|uniref:DUF547 domain-containing protein n=1 Tax=Seonamhaeicola marinus TaxID=1912246 RepID=A0A5D0HZ98_9FLAO|nr:DUF547 domain-containing protein [Seonamhaeicola marinus]TYA74822.1 DUF547 domain-containing protein [Seonamhaeicola marinus]
MKRLLLIIPLFIFSCSGSKKAVEHNAGSAQSSVLKAKVKQDSTGIKTKNAEKISDTIIETPKDTLIDSLKTEDFNQVLTKRTFYLHQLWDDLLQKYVSNEGLVNYKSLKTEQKDLYGYIHVLNLAYQHNSFSTLSKEEKLAYWINAYNAFTVDLIIRNYPIKSIKDIKNPWKQRHWKLGDKWYNLDEIEHQILRKMDEPRIHFAINCASVSCPKLQNRAFTGSNLEIQLDQATKDFINDSSQNVISNEAITISKLFQWFAKDFKKEGSLIDFLNQYSKVQISNQAKKSFMDYNWNLNE